MSSDYEKTENKQHVIAYVARTSETFNKKAIAFNLFWEEIN